MPLYKRGQAAGLIGDSCESHVDPFEDTVRSAPDLFLGGGILHLAGNIKVPSGPSRKSLSFKDDVIRTILSNLVSDYNRFRPIFK